MEKVYFILISLAIFVSCKTSQSINYQNAFWGELKSDYKYLYSSADTNSLVVDEVREGSIMLFIKPEGDFYEVQIRNNSITKQIGKFKSFWLYQPVYRLLPNYSSTKFYENIIKPDFTLSRIYYTGERGGCYYLGSSGNRIYVDKSFCGSIANGEYNYQKSNNSGSSTNNNSSGSTYVKGHYRTTKSGKTVYVKPHTRRKN